MNKLFLILGASAILMAGAVLNSQGVYAQLSKDPGASGLAPGVKPGDTPGWEPGLASANTPGQLKEGQHCIGCAAVLSPGQKALTAGIVGPDIKK